MNMIATQIILKFNPSNPSSPLQRQFFATQCYPHNSKHYVYPAISILDKF